MNWQEEDTGDDDGLPDCDWRKKNKSKSSTPGPSTAPKPPDHFVQGEGRGGLGRGSSAVELNLA